MDEQSMPDLEMTVRSDGNRGYAVQARLIPTDGAAERRYGEAPLDLNWEQLKSMRYEEDLDSYGKSLGAALLAHHALGDALRDAQTIAEVQGCPLRIRLNLEPSASDLQGILWETTTEPTSDRRIFVDGRVLFSRFISSSTAHRRRDPIEPKAVVAISSPTNFPIHALFQGVLRRIDVGSELERLRSALGPSSRLLGGERRATLMAILDEVRADCSVLYLMCHGLARDGVPYVVLELANGEADFVRAEEFISRVAQLARCPDLVILASCESAGNGQGSRGDDLARALGPGLAAVGVPAVVAMQGTISVESAATLIHDLLSELSADAQVDRALAVARAKLQDTAEWWIPTLYSRFRDGRIWNRALADGHTVALGCYRDALRSLDGSPYHSLALPSGSAVATYVQLQCNASTDDGAQGASLATTISEQLENKRGPVLLLQGAPGSGKSTLLRRLGRFALDDPTTVGIERSAIPLLVRLQSLSRASGASVEERLAAALAAGNDVVMRSALPDGFFTEWPRRCGADWLLLFDGLDEVDRDRRDEVLRWILEVNRAGYVVVVSSRPLELPVWFAEAAIPFTVQALTELQKEELASRWLGDASVDFMGALAKTPAELVVGTPLLMTLAILAYRARGGHLPESRAQLYEHFVDSWWREARDREILDELERDLVDVGREALQHLALTMTERPDCSTTICLQPTLAEFLETNLNYTPLKSRRTSERLLEALTRRSGVLVASGLSVDWVHPTFREYLTAEALAHIDPDSGEGCALLQLREQGPSEAGWRQVLLFLLTLWSRKKSLRGLFEHLLETESTHTLLLAGAAIAEGVEAGTEVSRRTVDALCSQALAAAGYGECARLLGDNFADERLSILGRLRARPLFVERVRGLEKELIRVARSKGGRFSAISDLGRLAGAPAIEALAVDEALSPGVRRDAAAWLASSAPSGRWVQLLLELARRGDIDDDDRARALSELAVYGEPSMLVELFNEPQSSEQIRDAVVKVLCGDEKLRSKVASLDRTLPWSETAVSAVALVEVRESARTGDWTRVVEAIDQPGASEDLVDTALALLAEAKQGQHIVGLGRRNNLSVAVRFKALAKAAALDDFDERPALIPLFDALLGAGADRAKVLKEKALLEWRLGKTVEGCATLGEHLRDHPEDSWAWATRGNWRRLNDEWAEAHADLSRAIDLGPPDAWDYVRRGHVLWQLNRYEEAVSDFEVAATLGGGEERFYAYWGDCLASLERWKEALCVLSHVVESDPEDANGWSFRGSVLMDVGDWTAAAYDLERARSLSPDNTWIRENWAYCLRHLGRLAEALEEFDSLLSQSDSDTNRYRRAEVHLALRNPLAARADIDAVLENNPEEPWYWYLAGLSRFEKSDQSLETQAAAKKYLDAALAKSLEFEDRTDSRVLSNHFLYNSALGNTAIADGLLDELLERDDIRQLLWGTLPELQLLVAAGGSRSLEACRSRILDVIAEKKPAWFGSLRSLQWDEYVETFKPPTVESETGADDGDVDSFLSSFLEAIRGNSTERKYPFPMYCGRYAISGLEKEKDEGMRLIKDHAGPEPTMVLWKFAEPDRLYGQCNFRMNADDLADLKFCDTVAQILNHDLPVFVSKYGLRTIVFTEEELAVQCHEHIERNGLRIACRHIDGRMFGSGLQSDSGRAGPLSLLARAKNWFTGSV